MRDRFAGVAWVFASALVIVTCSGTSEPWGGFFAGDGKPVSEDVGSPECLAVAGGRIFFTDRGAEGQAAGLRSVGAEGGAATLHASFEKTPGAVVSDGTAVWWIETSSDVGVVKRVEVASGAVTVVAEGLAEPRGLAIDDYHVYYVEAATGAIWRVDRDGGAALPVFTDGSDVVLALAADGEFVYFVRGFDAPSGEIRRVPAKAKPGMGVTSELVVTGLGGPSELVVQGNEVCWRELQGSVGCVDKAGGAPRWLDSQVGYVSTPCRTLAMDGTSVFYATPDGVLRAERANASPIPAPSVEPVLVARPGKLAYQVTSLALDGDRLYWADGLSLRQIDKSNVVVPGGATDDDVWTPDTTGGETWVNPGSGCPSVYDGTYFGIFAYEYEAGDPENPPLHTVTGSVSVTLRLECVAIANGTAALRITHAILDDPWFGCGVGGCTPQMGSSAALPAEVPTTVMNPSQAGHGIVLLLPNGTLLATTNEPGSVTVTTDARKLSNSPDPAIADQTWSAVCSGCETDFPPARKLGTPPTRWISWKMDKSAL